MAEAEQNSNKTKQQRKQVYKIRMFDFFSASFFLGIVELKI